jgi:hypothetical protein
MKYFLLQHEVHEIQNIPTWQPQKYTGQNKFYQLPTAYAELTMYIIAKAGLLDLYD